MTSRPHVTIAPTVDRQPPAKVWKVIDAVLAFLGPDAVLGLFVADHNHGDVHGKNNWSLALEGAYEWPFNFTEAEFAKRTAPSDMFLEPITGWCLGVYPDNG